MEPVASNDKVREPGWRFRLERPPDGRVACRDGLSSAGAGRRPRKDPDQADVAAHGDATFAAGAGHRGRGDQEPEQDGKGGEQRQDAAAERFHTGTLARWRFPEISQPLDRERLFRCAPIFHLTAMRECINS
jgi:hypothetical protein